MYYSACKLKLVVFSLYVNLIIKIVFFALYCCYCITQRISFEILIITSPKSAYKVLYLQTNRLTGSAPTKSNKFLHFTSIFVVLLLSVNNTVFTLAK